MDALSPYSYRGFGVFGFLYCLMKIVSASDGGWAEYVLSSSTLPSSTSSNFNSDLIIDNSTDISAHGPIQCFENPPPPVAPAYDPIVVEDYLRLLEKIVVDEDALRQVQRAFGPGDFEKRISGRCCISMGIIPSPGQSSSSVRTHFRQIELAHLAAKIAQKCFTERNTLGGTVHQGPGLQFLVILGALRTAPAAVVTS